MRHLNAVSEHRLDSVYGLPHGTQQCLLSSDLGDGGRGRMNVPWSQFSKYNPQKADVSWRDTKYNRRERQEEMG